MFIYDKRKSVKHRWLFRVLLSFFSILLLSFSAQAQEFKTDSFRVEGVCGSCKTRIEKALKVKGVQKADWQAKTNILTVTYDPSIISLIEMHQKVAAVGHDTELKKAEQKVYEALPECCLYKDPNNAHHEDGEEEMDPDTFVHGVVVAEDNKGNLAPLAGATIMWAGTQKGWSSDDHGGFAIPKSEATNKLVISYTGFKPDTAIITQKSQVQVVLAMHGKLAEVKITSKPMTTYINTSGPFRSVMIGSKELLKAACCNLSESFETNPSVDVSYADAVTGAKQIQLLGLSGNYSLLTVENLPGPRGLATPLGLNSIAGTWIESIQLSKGTGSVINGFESIAGQINVELKKPENSDKFFANAYINSMGGVDLNMDMAIPINEKWSTGILLHDAFLLNKVDDNKDGFRDLPTGNLFSAINRWHYNDNNGWMVQMGIKMLNDKKTGGEMNFSEAQKSSDKVYGLGFETQRYEAFAKLGYVFPNKKFKSIGLQLSAFDHSQDAYFGRTDYKAHQQNFYANLIYQNIIGNSQHKFKTGASIVADSYDETLKADQFKRKEIVPGAFFEYTWQPAERFIAVAGMRGDYNNLFGWFATPRLNVSYEPVHGTHLRMSIGRGQRTANIFAENMGTLVSARTLLIMGNIRSDAYRLRPEIAWNKGISIDQEMKLFSRKAMLSIDFYRNDFENQVVVDVEDPRSITFFNLDGKSYSNSFQTELNMIPINKLNVRLAYRFFDVKTQYLQALLQKPFTAKHRAFANVGYEYKDWKFDYTVNFVGEKRIPSTLENPDKYQMDKNSPSYFTMNAQISRSLGKFKTFDVYVGGENLGNYFQKNTIIAPEDPFGPYFDASMIWGPVSGRMIYGGIRYRIR